MVGCTEVVDTVASWSVDGAKRLTGLTAHKRQGAANRNRN